MNPDFWHQKWKSNQLGFHEKNGNSLFVKHFAKLALSENSRIFVPLCGKSHDMAWLLSQGHRVVGAELSQLAIEQLFDEIGITPQVKELGSIKLFSGPDIDIFVGDIFDVTRPMLGSVDAIFDRAALVALPEETRIHYAKHITDISNAAPQLLVTFEYDQSLITGPPFSISHDEVFRHYETPYDVKLIESIDLENGLKGLHPAKESVWHLAEWKAAR